MSTSPAALGLASTSEASLVHAKVASATTTPRSAGSGIPGMSFESAILFMSRHKVGRRAPVMMVLTNVGNRFLTVCEVAINMKVKWIAWIGVGRAWRDWRFEI